MAKTKKTVFRVREGGPKVIPKLTAQDYQLIATACQLRAEACDDNDEYALALRWWSVAKKAELLKGAVNKQFRYGIRRV